MSFITDKEIRSYLLGTLADEPREQIEDTLLIGDEGLLRLEIAEEDLIEDFLDDQLDAEQLALFQSHFLCTKARKEKLAYLRAIRAVAARQTEPEPATGKVINFPATQTRRSFFVGMNRSSYLKLAAAILIVGSVSFLVWRYALRPSQSASIVALNRAYAGGRTLETRIGGLDFAPYAPTRGANDADANARILRERAERIVLDAYAEHPTAANRHALGKYYLADKQFDKAIEQFNAALKETPTLAELHNDLGAALLEKSKLEKRSNQPGDSLQHMAASLESIEQALKLQPNYPAAVFNRALCLQEMYLPRQAIEEWKKYLQLDSNSKWADEARRRLAELEKAPSNISKSDDELYQEYLKDPANNERTFDLFCQAYSTTGNGITERVIDSYLAAKQSNNETEATYKLQLLEKLGSLIYGRTTDPYVRDVARYYQQLSPRLLPKLVKARYHLNQGRSLRSTSQSKAAENYEQAIALFSQAQNLCEVKMTRCLLGRSHLWQSNWKESFDLLSALSIADNEYIWLRGESLNGIADYYNRRKQSDESIHANQSALTLARQSYDTRLIINSLWQLADVYSDLGNWEQTFLYEQQGFEILTQKSTSLQQFWQVNTLAALHTYSFGFQSAALAYQREALFIEKPIGRPLQLSRAYTHLGAILGKNRQYHEAIQLVKNAISIGAKLGNEKQGIGIQAYSSLFLADLQQKAGDFAAAIESYEQVIYFYKQLGSTLHDYEIYRGKALTEIALGRTVQAKLDLAQSLTAFERNRDQIFSASERTTFFDKEYEIYDTAIGFAYQESPQAAFDVAEKSRARSLLEVLRTPNLEQVIAKKSITDRRQPLSNKEVQKQLPSNTYLVEFACLPDRLIVWCLSANGMSSYQKIISSSALEQKVDTYLQLLYERNPNQILESQQKSAELYQMLIEPLEPFLSKAETVCVVPDKALNYLPFAALFSEHQQKYLIENFALLTAPSASVFLLCDERARNSNSHPSHRILAVGNPRFDHTQFPQLPDLPVAALEANDVARNYSHSRVLTNQNATETAVKSEIKKASIIHLATHSVIDQRSSPNSRLILANSVISDGEDGSLRSYEIARMRLPQARLVVLSACQSGVERFYRGEGMIGLSRAFLVTGVPSVVASLWAVDSEAAEILMVDFHHQLKNYSVAQSLRRAQLNLLRYANRQYSLPYYWAAFSAMGGDTLL